MRATAADCRRGCGHLSISWSTKSILMIRRSCWTSSDVRHHCPVHRNSRHLKVTARTPAGEWSTLGKRMTLNSLSLFVGQTAPMQIGFT